jgi:hypothetical protein
VRQHLRIGPTLSTPAGATNPIPCGPNPEATSAHGAGTGLTPATSALELGSPLPHLHWEWAHPCHICTGTGLTPATSALGLPVGLTPALSTQPNPCRRAEQSRAHGTHVRSMALHCNAVPNHGTAMCSGRRSERFILYVACCILYVACCKLYVACCIGYVARCIGYVACRMLQVASCVLQACSPTWYSRSHVSLSTIPTASLRCRRKRNASASGCTRQTEQSLSTRRGEALGYTREYSALWERSSRPYPQAKPERTHPPLDNRTQDEGVRPKPEPAAEQWAQLEWLAHHH